MPPSSALLIASLSLAWATPLPSANRGNHRSLFDEWKAKYDKVYAEAEHEAERLEIFLTNLQLIHKHNLEQREGKHTYTLGLGPFSDLTNFEFKSQYLSAASYDANRTRNNVVRLPTATFFMPQPTKPGEASMVGLRGTVYTATEPEALDWRERGVVTAVKNQGKCGSCWSFSTTGAVEGAASIAGHKLTALSEQQLIDCSAEEGNKGCDGGSMDAAFRYIQKNGGLDTETDYEYQGVEGTCDVEKAAKRGHGQVTGHVDVPPRDEAQLLLAVAKQPVSIAIEADKPAFQHYKSGVLGASSGCGQKLDHGVLLVGYGTDTGGGGDYWIIKNSWGSEWGSGGYIKVARAGQRDTAGTCGVNLDPSYPTVSGRVPPPHPGPSPAPPAPPPAPPRRGGHYEDPAAGGGGGCRADEAAVSIAGVAGAFCSPLCSAAVACPTDVPARTTASPECVLQTSHWPWSRPTHCALVCTNDPDGCPTGARCSAVAGDSGSKLCVYDDGTSAAVSLR